MMGCMEVPPPTKYGMKAFGLQPESTCMCLRMGGGGGGGGGQEKVEVAAQGQLARFSLTNL